MHTLVREARLAVRPLRRDPICSLTAILTLALGIGATTAVFSVLYGVLLSPLPFPDGEQLVRLYSTNARQDTDRRPMSGSDVWDVRAAGAIAAAAPLAPYEGTLEDEQGQLSHAPPRTEPSDVIRLPLPRARRERRAQSARLQTRGPTTIQEGYPCWAGRHAVFERTAEGPSALSH